MKYSIRRMEIRYSVKFITVIPPRPPESGQNASIYRHYTPSLGGAGAKCIILSPLYPRARQRRGKMHQFDRRYTPAPASAGARCINLSPLYPRARRQRGKMHQFIAVIPPRPPAPGQDASIYRHYTPAPASAGARCINLSPLYPRARRHRGKMHHFIAVIPPAPADSGARSTNLSPPCPHHISRLTVYTIIARKILLQQIKRRRSHAQDRFMEFYRRKIVTVLALHLSAELLEF